jgi:hypothetical protein
LGYEQIPSVLIEVELLIVLFPKVLVAITAIFKFALLVRSEGEMLTVVAVPEYIVVDQITNRSKVILESWIH